MDSEIKKLIKISFLIDKGQNKVVNDAFLIQKTINKLNMKC